MSVAIAEANRCGGFGDGFRSDANVEMVDDGTQTTNRFCEDQNSIHTLPYIIGFAGLGG